MGINLRKPSQAIISDGSITKEKLASGAVDASKIEDGAIDLSTAKVIGELPNSKLAQIEDVAKIKDNILTLAKMTDDVKLESYVGGEEPQSVTGDLYQDLIETGFTRGALHNPRKLRIVASIKIEVPTVETAIFGIFIDDEALPRAEMTSVSDAFELVNAELDVSDLGAGKHKLVMKAKGSEATSIVSNDYVDIFMVK